MYNFEKAHELRKAPPSVIEAEQLRLLNDHLKQTQSVGFYADRFGAAGNQFPEIQTLAEFAELPFTTREDLDNYADDFGLKDTHVLCDYALTSGTTGEPVVVPYTRADLSRLAFNEAMAFSGVGVTRADTVMLTVTLDRCFIAGLAYYSGVVELGAAAVRSGPGQPARQWHLMEKLQPEVMVGVPSFLKDLGGWLVENGVDLRNNPVSKLVTIGDPIRKSDLSLTAMGEELEELWGAKLYSSYGATEFETAFCECPASVGGHVHPELMVVEIVGDNGRLLDDGEAGEVVVTPLGVEGFPLLRFKTGDVARLYREPCNCGWNTPRLGPIEGRLKQRLKYRGTTLYPETVFQTLQELFGIQDAFIEVSSDVDGSDDILVVVGVDEGSMETAQIVEQLQGRLRVKPKVNIWGREKVREQMFKDGGRKPRKFFDFR